MRHALTHTPDRRRQRRLGAISIVLGCALSAAVEPANAGATARSDYTAPGSPWSQNWIIIGAQPTSAIGGPLPAWRIDNGMSFRGRPEWLPPETLTEGWRLRTTLKVNNPNDTVDRGVSVQFGDGEILWRLDFGSDAAGNPIVRLDGHESYALGSGSGAFHTYDLVFTPDPDGGSATLFVDGVERVTGYKGNGDGSHRVVEFGAPGFGATGSGDWHQVQLSTFDPLTVHRYAADAHPGSVAGGIWGRAGTWTGCSEGRVVYPVSHTHAGAVDPVDHGWSAATEAGGIAFGPVDPDAHDGETQAWSIDDAGGGKHTYTKTPAASAIQDAQQFGWSLLARVRVVDPDDEPDGSVMIEYSDGAATYVLLIGAEDGQPKIELPGHGSYLLEGLDDGYHTYEMVHNVEDTLKIFVDGIEVVGDYPGNPSNGTTRILWGSGNGSTTGHAHFAQVSWDAYDAPGSTRRLPAWFIQDAAATSNTTCTRLRTPSAQDIQRARDFGFTLRANLKVDWAPDTVDFSVAAEYADGSRTYQMRFGSDAEGRPLVRAGGQTHTVEDTGGGFHLYELRSETGEPPVDLYVDGELVQEGLPASASSLRRIYFGSAQSSSTGRGSYNLVELDVGRCGDGDQDLDEECDDGNVTAGDGCFDCRFESGWECRRPIPDNPTVEATPLCEEICGDGIRTPGEECEDGNLMPGDGCGPDCEVELGWDCPELVGPCNEVCGDWVLTPSEGCDDGNTIGFDRCTGDCRREYLLELYGVASGGAVQLTIAGEPIAVTTTFGQTPAQIAVALAAAINDHPGLGAADIRASTRGALLSATAPMENVSITDPTVMRRDTGSLVPVEFTESSILMPGLSVVFHALDYDDDTDLDVVTYNPDTDVVLVYLNDGGSPPQFVGYPVATVADVTDLQAANLTPAPFKDILLATENGAVILEPSGSTWPASFTAHPQTPFHSVSATRVIRAADLVPDPAPDDDLEVFMSSGSRWVAAEYDHVFHRFNSPCIVTFDTNSASAAAFGRSPIDVGDVDGDGYDDILHSKVGVPTILYDLCGSNQDVGLGSNFSQDELDYPRSCESVDGACELQGPGELPPHQDAYCTQGSFGDCYLHVVIDSTSDPRATTVRLADVDGNGWIDVVARRCPDRLSGPCELVWLKNYGRTKEGGSPFSPAEQAEFSLEELIGTGGVPVDNITVEDLDLDGADEIILFGPDSAGEFTFLDYDIVERTFNLQTLPGDEPRFVVARDLEADTDTDLFVWPQLIRDSLTLFTNNTVIEFDTDDLTVRGDADGQPNAINGVPFVTDVADGIAKFKLAGSLSLGTDYRRVIRARGSRPLSIHVADDLSVSANVTFDVSSSNDRPVAGGGWRPQLGGAGGSGGRRTIGGFGGVGGSGGVGAFYLTVSASVIVPLPPFDLGGEGWDGERPDLGEDGDPGSFGDFGADGFHALGSGGNAGSGGSGVFGFPPQFPSDAGEGGGTLDTVFQVDAWCPHPGQRGKNGSEQNGRGGGWGNPGLPGTNTGFGPTISAGGQGGSGGGGAGGAGGAGGQGGGGGGGGHGRWYLWAPVERIGRTVAGCGQTFDSSGDFLSYVIGITADVALPYYIVGAGFTGWGGTGGKGGDGGPGGTGGQGGAGGAGGAGGGAIEVGSNGRVFLDAEMSARGGDGAQGEPGRRGASGSPGEPGKPGKPGTKGFQCCFAQGVSALFLWDWDAFRTAPGGTGGTGGRGGRGGDGGGGGLGGPGGGGGGGTVKVFGSVVESRARVDVAGGSSGHVFGAPGGPGRFLIASHAGGFEGTLVGPDAPEVYAGPVEANPLTDHDHETAFIPGLVDGAELYGLLHTSAAAVVAERPELATIPPQTDVVVLRMDRGPVTGNHADDLTGFDMVLMMNVSGDTLANPRLALGRNLAPRPLLLRGSQRNPYFGGGGAVVLPALAPGQVYGTLVPEEAIDVSVGFDSTGGPVEAVAGSLTVGSPLYLASSEPSNSLELFGLGLGGSVEIVVDGVSIAIDSLPEQTSEALIEELARRINGHATLRGMGIAAYADGARLVVNGTSLEVFIDDDGLNSVGCPVVPEPLIDTDSVVNDCRASNFVELGTQDFLAVRWFRDGQRIAGAASADYAASLSGDYVVRAQGDDGCVGFSPPVSVVVGFCPTSEISPPGAVFPLRVDRDANTGYIRFQELSGVESYNLYTGALGEWYSHDASAACGLNVEPLGGGELRSAFALSPTAAQYFLVTGAAGADEGVSHRASDGTPVADAFNTCDP